MIESVIKVPESAPDYSAVRTSLRDRRRRLAALPAAAVGPRVVSLLSEVDAALDRLEGGAYGVCTRCDGFMDTSRMIADPLATVCLECLDETELKALERDLEMASRVQATLLPPRDFATPQWRGHYAYRPFGPVSGDYVDVLPVDDDLVVMVGDVSGKGLPAAMLMSQLHALFRAVATPTVDLGEMLGRVGTLLSSSTAANTYATLVAARLGADGRVELCSAGHAPALSLGVEGATAQPTDGVPLGLFPGSTYTTRELELAPGDGLLLYTDGLSEGLDPDECELGVDGIMDLVATRKGTPRELVDACLAAVERHRRGAPAHDDLTVLALRREG